MTEPSEDPHLDSMQKERKARVEIEPHSYPVT